MKKFILITISVCLFIGCSKSSTTTTAEAEAVSDSYSNIMESAVSDASSHGGSVSEFPTLIYSLDDEEAKQAQVNSSEISPYAVCSYSTQRSACSGGVQTIDWAGCTLGTATVTGVITETYTNWGAGSCILTQGDTDPATSSTVVRKITTDRVVTLASGATLTSDMSPDTAWDGTTFPSASTGTKIIRRDANFTDTNSISHTCGSSTNSCFNITVNGLQNVLKGPKGTKWFDHIITSDLTTKGKKSLGTMVVNGKTSVWHQVTSYKAVNTFSNVTWGDSTCCYPTSGSIATVFTGAITGSASLAFSSTCGQATLTGTDSSTSTLTLTQCQK